MEIKKILKEWKIWLVIILVIISLIAIHPFTPTNGVRIEGVHSPAPSLITVGQVITKINDYTINNLTDYNNAVLTIKPEDPVRIEYREEQFLYSYATVQAAPYLATAGSNNTTNIGLNIGKVPSNNLQFGLEIIGGTKILLAPNRTLDSSESENLVQVLEQRLNLFGLKEVPVTFLSDFSGNQYVMIEFTGMSEDDIKLLLEKEGHFEGRIGNQTVFTGQEIVDVCISGVQCTMSVQPMYTGTSAGDRQIIYQFEFQIDLSKEAAERFANVTSNLSIGECSQSGCYLSENLNLYLDGELIQDGELRLPENIKGEVLTSARITGTRTTMSEAQKEMRRLQAILQSRNLPVKLTIARVEFLSPVIGEDFMTNIFAVFAAALLTVSLIIGARYKNIKVALPIIAILLIEVMSTLGVSSLLGVTLDLPAIAGIISSVGTCLDDQIIITDEILGGGRKDDSITVKNRIKRAFLIIIAAFMTSFVSMIPLTFSTAGLLKGFAITTMIGITIGVLITRPAYARICELLFQE